MATTEEKQSNEQQSREQKLLELDKTCPYRLEVPIHRSLLKNEHFIGRDGETQRNIEEKTETKLTMPLCSDNVAAYLPITIHGNTNHSLYMAKKMIYNKVEWIRARRPLRPTHFIGIPLHSDSIQAQVKEFNHEVIRTCSDSRGVDEDILQNPIKMHLTIAVLMLLFPEEVQEAVEAIGKVIEKCKNELWDFDASPLRVSLDGIARMNTTDPLTSARIVYAQVISPPRVQEFADTLLHEMIARKPLLVKDEHRSHINLHATIMNTKWRSSSVGSLQSFDATKIFDIYGDFRFGKCEPTEVLLLSMCDTDEKGFYGCSGTFSLTTQ